VSAWQRVQPGIFEAGDVAGEDQVGEAWSARWMRPLTVGVDAAPTTHGRPTWAVIDCTYYGSAGTTFEYPIHVRCVTTFTVCTDPDQPFLTETTPAWDVDNDVNLDEFDSLDVSDERIRDFAENDETPDDNFWNVHAEAAGHWPAMMLAVTE
jgi:hypothetical protein